MTVYDITVLSGQVVAMYNVDRYMYIIMSTIPLVILWILSDGSVSCGFKRFVWSARAGEL